MWGTSTLRMTPSHKKHICKDSFVMTPVERSMTPACTDFPVKQYCEVCMELPDVAYNPLELCWGFNQVWNPFGGDAYTSAPVLGNKLLIPTLFPAESFCSLSPFHCRDACTRGASVTIHQTPDTHTHTLYWSPVLELWTVSSLFIRHTLWHQVYSFEKMVMCKNWVVNRGSNLLQSQWYNYSRVRQNIVHL